MAYLTQSKSQLLSSALQKIQSTTAITNVSPGSVARALVEIIATQLGDFYNILDFNTTQSALATANGRAIDLFGSLFNTPRKSITDIAIVDRSLGSFYFYLNSPITLDVLIPAGTNIFTDNSTFLGQQFSYQTTDDVIIPAGHTIGWASIRPNFSTAVYTAGVATLTVIDPNFTQPPGTFIFCTNPKPIDAQAVMESDSNYRARVLSAVQTAAGGTTASIRMTALGINGVRDVTIRETPYGLGSFEALVVSEDNAIFTEVMTDVFSALDAIRPIGVRMYVRQPITVPVGITCSIIVRADTTSINRANTVQRTQNAILRYLNTPLVGTPLVFNQLIQAILDASDYTTDVIFSSFAVNGVETLRKNYQPADDVQLIPGSILVSIAN